MTQSKTLSLGWEPPLTGNEWVNQSFWRKLIFLLVWFALFPFLAILVLICGCASLPSNTIYNPATKECDCERLWNACQQEFNTNARLTERIAELETGDCGKWVYKFCEEVQ